jgi:diguanylate cyclase (GGDEF)-like protein
MASPEKPDPKPVEPPMAFLKHRGWRARVVALGRWRSILVLTLFSVVTSIALTSIGMSWMGVPDKAWWQGLMLSAMVPAIVAPLATYAITGLVFELEVARTRLHQLAIRDGLTQAHNRIHLFDQLPREVQRAQRSGQPLSLLMLDADHFKQINDEHGHASGDAVLRSMAAVCRSVLRPYDLLVRYGGEEFVLLLIGTGIDAASDTAERLRLACADLPLQSGSGTAIRVTVSIGVAELRADDVDGSELVERADTALYLAKRAGRNCCRCWTA